MARRQSRKHRLFRSANPSFPASSAVSSGGSSQSPVPDAALIFGASGDVSQGALARMRRIFHRPDKSLVAGTTSGAQEQREQTQAVQTQDTQGPTDNLETGAVLVAPGSNVNSAVGPLDDTSKGGVDPGYGVDATPSPAPASVGSKVDAARRALDLVTPIPHIGQTTIGLITEANTAVASIQNFSSTYLQPLKVFNSVVTTVAK
ncbi:hypothetical protein EV401DRAFT_2210810, partial [Pisolithus croceorrhizus]